MLAAASGALTAEHIRRVDSTVVMYLTIKVLTFPKTPRRKELARNPLVDSCELGFQCV